MTSELGSVRRRRAAALRLMSGQEGVLSLDQAEKVGLDPAAVQRMIESKEWLRVGPRVVQAADHEYTAAARTFAAMLSVGRHATLVGRSAAWWWDLHGTAPAKVELAVGPPHQPRTRRDVDVRRRAVDPCDRTTRRRLAVTKRPLTVLDASVRLGLSDGARLVDRALQRRKVTLGALREVHARLLGRHGSRLAGELIALAAGGARSEAERVSHRLLRASGISGWRPNEEILLPGFGRAVGDLVFAEQRVVVEVDGWAYHRDLRAFLVDGPRQSALAAAGWTVIRTHWYELLEAPEVFLSTLRRTLARSPYAERTLRYT